MIGTGRRFLQASGKRPYTPAPKPEKPVEELGKSHENTHEKENDPEKSKDPSSNDPKKSES
ncbi:MAG: hypothetical protein LUE27_08155 [Clostridia bacterium]|nr:hypothetical protein [Clostridia bacterium]